MRLVRVAKLPPEIQDKVLGNIMSKHGDVKDITEEQWSRVFFRYPLPN
jgi:hypothetical protein